MQTNKAPNRVDDELRAMREANNLPHRSIVDLDPEDPTQRLDDGSQFSTSDLNIEAQPHAEADAELAAAVADTAGEEGGEENEEEASEVDEDASELDTPSQTTADAYADAAHDTGELYGVHLPRPAESDIDINPDGESFRDSELGEHAFETLEKKMAEFGADPERELDIVDNSDADRGHHSIDRRDRPVADKGSGGSGGL